MENSLLAGEETFQILLIFLLVCLMIPLPVSYTHLIRTYATNTPCEHPARYLEARGKKTDFQTVGTAGICYKERLIISNKCKKCNRIGIKTYSPWSYCSKHSYPALKKTCKICGYTKK